MRPAKDAWGGVGPMLVVAAWACAVVVTVAAVVEGIHYFWKRITT